MVRVITVATVLLVAAAAMAARVYAKNERLQLTAARATSFHNVIVGQLPGCSSWRQGAFRKECVLGASIQDLPPSGVCPSGYTQQTSLYVHCRYTPATLTDVPDGAALETE